MHAAERPEHQWASLPSAYESHAYATRQVKYKYKQGPVNHLVTHTHINWYARIS